MDNTETDKAVAQRVSPEPSQDEQFRHQVLDWLLDKKLGNELSVGKLAELTASAKSISTDDLKAIATNAPLTAPDTRKAVAGIESLSAAASFSNYDGSKDERANLINQLAAAQINDLDVATAEHDKYLGAANGEYKQAIADAGGLVATQGALMFLRSAPVSGLAKLGLSIGSYVAGGIINNELAGREAISQNGFIRNGIENLSINVAKQALAGDAGMLLRTSTGGFLGSGYATLPYATGQKKFEWNSYEKDVTAGGLKGLELGFLVSMTIPQSSISALGSKVLGSNFTSFAGSVQGAGMMLGLEGSNAINTTNRSSAYQDAWTSASLQRSLLTEKIGPQENTAMPSSDKLPAAQSKEPSIQFDSTAPSSHLIFERLAPLKLNDDRWQNLGMSDETQRLLERFN